MEGRENGFLGSLRVAGLIAVLAGAVGSVGFMLRAGRRNDSQLLLALFAFWVGDGPYQGGTTARRGETVVPLVVHSWIRT